MLMNAIIDALGERISDTDDIDFSVNHKILALNNAQKILVSLINDYYLPDLKVKNGARIVTIDSYTGSGKVDLSDLYDTNVSVGGVTASSPVDGSPTVFTRTSHPFVNDDIVTLSDFDEMLDVNGLTGIVEDVTGNTFKIKGVLGAPAETTGGKATKTTSAGVPIRNGIYKIYDYTNSRKISIVPEQEFPDDPKYPYGTICCISDNNLLINPSTCVLIDVYYIKEPTEFTDSATECDFGTSLEVALLDLAESELWYADKSQVQGDKCYSRAMEHIKLLNSRLSELNV